MRWQGAALVTPSSPNGIVDLEFASTDEKLRHLRLFWDHDTVVDNIFLDVLFIIAYTWFFVTGCRFIKNRRQTKWNDWFIAIAFAAGLFDVLENLLMLLVWNGRFSAAALQIVFYAAAIKFILAGIIVIYLLISIPLLFKKTSQVQAATYEARNKGRH